MARSAISRHTSAICVFTVIFLVSTYALFSSTFAQADSAQVDSAGADSAQVDSAQVDSAQVDSAGAVVYESQIVWSKAELLGQISPDSHPDFVSIPKEFATREGIFLRRVVLSAFEDMRFCASEEGIELVIISGARSFAHQLSIWERKWERPRYMGWADIEKSRDILLYSSMPGTSRHHWGTDIDLNSLDNSYFETSTGLETYVWLQENAPNFGFHQVYTSKIDDSRKGYEEERWHWSYLPLASPMLDAYNQLIATEDISGFSGSTTADSVKIIPHFVNGVNVD